jgi:hypothetical protein
VADGPGSRFAAGLEHLGALATPSQAAVLEQLATAPVAGIGRVVYSSNAVFLLELEAPDPFVEGRPMQAIYKPALGERPLWDFPRRTLHLRERAAWLLDAALGLGLVPPTGLRDGPHGPGSVQLFIHERSEPLAAGTAEGLEAQLRRLAVLDVIANNADRKRAHLLVDGDAKLWGIDNALSFLPYPRQRTVLMELGGELFEAVGASAVQRLVADAARLTALRGALARLLDGEEVDAVEARLRRFAEEPRYPELDPWDGRPFEWW